MPAGHAKIGESLHFIGELLGRLGRIDEAVPVLERALPIADAVFPPGHRARVSTRLALARLHVERRRPDDALALLGEAEEMLRVKPSALQEAHVRFTTARALRLARRDPARARALMTQARTVYASMPSEKEQLAAADRFLAGR